MRFRTNWFWDVYFFVYAFSAVFAAGEFVLPNTGINLYYRFLIAFNIIYIIPYFLNLLQVLVNILSLFPFASYLYRLAFFSPQFSRWLLACRLLLDIFGRSYQAKAIEAILHHDKNLAIITICVAVLYTLPSYWAHLSYAFLQRAR